MRRSILLLTTAVSLLGCTLMSLFAETAVARSGVASAAVRGHAGRGVRRQPAAAEGCRPKRGHGCQASAKRLQRGGRPHGGRPATRSQGSSAPAAAVKVRAAQIAAVLAAPCENTQLTPEPGNIALVRTAILCLVNRERAQNGEMPLRLSQDLVQAAEGHSQELISADYFAHVSPSGETPVDRVRETGYIPGPSVGYVIGENLAWGTYGLSTPAAIVSAWIASPGHLANILESQYSETGIGVTPQVPAGLGSGGPGATYAQEFGVIVH
ncbi:MAG TPA: CAP domain-containing protein [Solirubrobacteraceae bacterium]